MTTTHTNVKDTKKLSHNPVAETENYLVTYTEFWEKLCIKKYNTAKSEEKHAFYYAAQRKCQSARGEEERNVDISWPAAGGIRWPAAAI